MASTTEINGSDSPVGIARTPTQGSILADGSRVARGRFAYDKSDNAKEKNIEYWKSIVPSPSSLGLEEIYQDEVYDEIQKRVRREAKYLCLFPSDDFSEANVGGGSSKPKRHNEWLRCASSLVTASLNLDSPNPIGWKPPEESFMLSRLQSGEAAPSYWVVGAFCRLRGAQPWQATRSYIASKVYELLEAEGWEHWITSQARWDDLGDAARPTIVKYLQDCNSDFNLSGNSDLLNNYAQMIWSKFVDDHLKILHKKSAALAPLYSLTRNYVMLVGAKLEMCGQLNGTFLSSMSKPTAAKTSVSEIELKSLIMKRVKKLQYEYFPLIQNSQSALEGVRDKVFERLHAMSRCVRTEDVSNSKVVVSILNDLEDQSEYLSTINQLFRVRVCLSDIVDPSVSSFDASSMDNKATKRTLASSDSSSIGQSTKRSKYSNSTPSKNHRSEDNVVFEPLTLTELQEANCGNCVLCSMPDCERCFACLENKSTLNIHSMKCCIRKMCCRVPTQMKGQSAVTLGLPGGWRFSFDDPERCTLVRRDRIVAPFGMKIISPDGKQFNSLQSAFGHIQHSSPEDAIKLVETFLEGLGSSQYRSHPNHFLVGRDFCIEFMSSCGSRITFFGRIVGCMKSNSTPSREVSRDNDTFFVLQYHQDAVEAARRSGTNISPIQLISAVTAWGGCITFERKTMIKALSKGVVLSIDQSTPVETWITPDMQWQEVITKSDGTKLPQLTVIVRGYKLVFRPKVSHQQDGRLQHGLYASCAPYATNKTAEEVLNLRPGELVDLGVCGPHQDEDSKELAVFIAKNYIHSLKCGRWGFLVDNDNIIYDLTDDITGDLRELVLTGGLSYARKSNKSTESPTLHARLDPSGKVHYLFGIPYQGSWSEFETSMKQLVPLFSGKEMEVTIFHGSFQGNNKRFIETKHLQVIRMFQLEDIVPCFNFLLALIPNAAAAKKRCTKLLRRVLRVVHCLEIRARELNDAAEEISKNSNHCTLITNTLLKLKAMKKMIEDHVEL